MINFEHVSRVRARSVYSALLRRAKCFKRKFHKLKIARRRLKNPQNLHSSRLARIDRVAPDFLVPWYYRCLFAITSNIAVGCTEPASENSMIREASFPGSTSSTSTNCEYVSDKRVISQYRMIRTARDCGSLE